MSHIFAARAFNTWIALRAAKIVAMPDENVPRLPSVVSLCPSDAVSAIVHLTRSYGMPSSSAAISDSDAREPPTSTVPTASDTVPSTPMFRSVQVWPPKLNQNPHAMPRPWFLPSGAFMCG